MILGMVVMEKATSPMQRPDTGGGKGMDGQVSDVTDTDAEDTCLSTGGFTSAPLPWLSSVSQPGDAAALVLMVKSSTRPANLATLFSFLIE